MSDEENQPLDPAQDFGREPEPIAPGEPDQDDADQFSAEELPGGNEPGKEDD